MTTSSNRLSPKMLRDRFVTEATRKFAAQVPDFVALQKLVAENGGRFLNDHGAIRTADPALRALIVRAAGVIGLRKELDYSFPSKKLVSFDLQAIGEDSRQFKIFVSQVDLPAFPPDVAAMIQADCAEQAAAVDHSAFIALIEKAEAEGGLSDADGAAFVQHFVHKLMHRVGAPMKRSLLEAVAAVSGEAASALALGADFNHVTIDVYAAAFAGIEAMTAAMKERGFRMLPAIQGAPGTLLRQTATMAATMETPVLEADGSTGSAQTEKQFVEIIERNQATNAWGGKLWTQDGAPLIFRNFLSANAEKIFDAASTKVAPAKSADSC
ncbi:2-oxoadipate dioxygenase/decarboxylase family protein [Hydrocarboniphaga sp.]|uniref:2-oxoadipate dioxygenase/decarboxylase family protein n=1 Tax=Hydrocarboniphaga sp. TaxID=2033016 RepID=UPI003D0BBA02